jgi:hypothetical protein
VRIYLHPFAQWYLLCPQFGSYFGADLDEGTAVVLPILMLSFMFSGFCMLGQKPPAPEAMHCAPATIT